MNSPVTYFINSVFFISFSPLPVLSCLPVGSVDTHVIRGSLQSEVELLFSGRSARLP